jgi:hypothetical protein
VRFILAFLAGCFQLVIFPGLVSISNHETIVQNTLLRAICGIGVYGRHGRKLGKRKPIFLLPEEIAERILYSG